MEIRQIQGRGDLRQAVGPLADMAADVVLVFGPMALFQTQGFAENLAADLPGACCIGCTTAGEITGAGVSDGVGVFTAVKFARTRHRVAEATIAAMGDSAAAGRSLGRALAAPDLKAVLMFGKGVDVNGSALIEGIVAEIGADVPVSGGLADDGGAFTGTLTLTPSGVFGDRVVALGLYGDDVRIGHGSFGGWSPFGTARKVTRSEGNVLFELDGQPALALYRDYLGEYAKNLPSSGLLFPFEMLREDHTAVGLIRTILGIDEAAGSLILAGDIDPEGYLRLMHASNDGLVDGAETSAKRALAHMDGGERQTLAVLVSCVGRKLVMGDAIDDEVEAVAGALGKRATLAGFYSYGEIAPFESSTDCKLHNQTMTVTLIDEA